METHERDPTSDGSVDPWTTFQEEWSELGNRLKGTYRRVTSAGGPTEEEIREAFGTLVGAWNQVAGSVSTALQDPEVRQRLKDAGNAFAVAIGRTISELGSELADSEDWQPSTPNDSEED